MGNEVSVIIPVYNAENYIQKTLQNILDQELIQMEIICIDDGSIDNSVKIIRDMMEKYSNISLYCNPVNKGQAYARNIGLNMAKGEYIYFMDCDDLLISNLSIHNIYTISKQEDLDILMFDAKLKYEKDELMANHKFREKIESCSLIDNKDYSGQEVLGTLLTNMEFWGACWIYLYKREFLIQNNLLFKEDTSPHEDFLFTFTTFIYAEKVRYIHEYVYEYFVRMGSSIHGTKMRKRLTAYGKVYSYALDVLEAAQDRIEAILERALVYYLDGCFSYLVNNMKQIYEEGIDLNKLLPLKEQVVFSKVALAPYKYICRFFSPDEYKALKKATTVYLYGAGKAGESINRYLFEMGIKNTCFVVSESKNENDKLIDSLVGVQDDYEIVLSVANGKNKKIMLKNAKVLGLKEPIIIT